MTTLLAECRYRQGRFLGSLADLGFPALEIPALQTLVDEVVKTSEIEGEILDGGRGALVVGQPPWRTSWRSSSG